MATMQVASHPTRSPIIQGSYAVDTASESRRQYIHQTSQTGEQSGNQSRAKTPPQSSSRRPSKRTSGSEVRTASMDFYQSSMGHFPLSSNMTREQDSVSATKASPVTSITASAAPYQQARKDPRGQQLQQGGPPISPPPRTSSHQRAQSSNAPSHALLPDRSLPSPPVTHKVDDRSSSSRDPNIVRQNDERGQIGMDDRTSGANLREEHDTTATAAAANAARSRRRGATSTDDPSRSASTRESGHQQYGITQQGHSISNVASGISPNKPTVEETQIINRVVVDDPANDIRREQERQIESVPGLAVVDAAAAGDTAKSTPRSRQDYATGSGSTGRRKETRFGDYILGQTLGEGEFGKVKLGWKRNGEVQVAIKLIRRETLGQNPSRLPKIYREVAILRGLEHPNIVKLHEMIETPQFIGIILEYASGGELFDYILNHRYLRDNMARKLFAQLVSGVGYLHKKGIVHRDLKLENLLLDRNRNIVITDFGFANTFDPLDELEDEIEQNLTSRNYVKKHDLERIQNGTRRGDLMATSCGSPCYAAPELVVTDSLYTGRKVDVWSCGVILYAMLAGYLPFDDDPANPEGDNINLLYKYITSTPLTFPEYVTPHARDLLRRILVPDPRKRADLFEVARHSWLSDFAHVVAQVTSSTTTVGDIANVTITADQQEPPLLVRSASVREPTKVHPSNVSPVGGLSHQGKIDPSQATDKSKAARDPKRRTVQVEYVAPQRQTVRGETMTPIGTPATDESPQTIPADQSKARLRAGTEGSREVRSQHDETAAVKSTLKKPPPLQDTELSQTIQQGKMRSQPANFNLDMAPPAQSQRDLPRSVSHSTSAFGQVPPSATRPTTRGSTVSTGPGRLPSRGNSYSQPLAPTVAATNAEARLAQPKNGKQYNISAPIPQLESDLTQTAVLRPSTQPYNSPALSAQRGPSQGHKRSNTLGNFFRTGSISGSRSQPQSPGELQKEKRYPPTSMKAPIAPDSPRHSIESRRPSFNFARKSSELRKNSDAPKQEKARRFSLLPASFSLKSLTSAGSGKDQTESRPASERRQSNALQQVPASRAQPRPQTVAYTSPQNEIKDYQQENLATGYDGSRERIRSNPSQQPRRKDVKVPNEQQTQYRSPQSQFQPDSYPLSRPPQPGQSYLGTPTESEISLSNRREHSIYPQGFNDNDEDQPRVSMQQTRLGRGPNVLQKNNRRFADAYEQDSGPGYTTGGQHAGTSGAAKRVMDFFRRRGKARVGEMRG